MNLSEQLGELVNLEKQRIRRELRSCINHLPDAYAKDYIDTIKKEAVFPDEHGHFHRAVITSFFIQSGFLQGWIVHEGQVVYSMGAEILPWEDSYRTEESYHAGNREASALPGHLKGLLWIKEQGRKHQDLAIHGVIPERLEHTIRLIIDSSMLPFVENYVEHLPGGLVRKPLNLWERLEKRMTAAIDEALEKHPSIVLSRLTFGSLNPYFEYIGEFKSFEMMDKIQEDVLRNLEASETYFRFSPLIYVILTPGSDLEAVRAKMRSQVFYIDSLVLDFHVDQTVVHAGYRPAQVWKEIHLS